MATVTDEDDENAKVRLLDTIMCRESLNNKLRFFFWQGERDEPLVDNSSTVVRKIANLYAERLMSDVCLVVGNAEFPSHRLILCASSDVFQVMLMNPNWSESQEKRVVLRETPSCEAVFEDFLKYLYTGKILLDYATVIPLVSLADKYDVKDLLRIGLDYMSRNVATACKRNQVVSWHQFASASGHRHVFELCKLFIKANFQQIAANIDFPNMELDNLLEFLCMNDLVIRDERTLFGCVDAWLCGRKENMERAGEEHIELHMDRYIQAILPHIRFPMMSPAQLADLLLSPLSTSHTELLVEKIRVAMSYHNDQLFNRDDMIGPLWSCFNSRLFTPRLYTAEQHCASLVIENVHMLPSYHCRGLLFSSQTFLADHLGDKQSEWTVDVYPKGVLIQRCLTVYKPSGLEVPEKVLKTIRVAISTKCEDVQRVRIGILIAGWQDGFEHIRKVCTRNYIFGEGDQVVNFDDVLPVEEFIKSFNMRAEKAPRSYYLSDEGSLKVTIVITPLNEFSSLELS